MCINRPSQISGLILAGTTELFIHLPAPSYPKVVPGLTMRFVYPLTQTFLCTKRRRITSHLHGTWSSHITSLYLFYHSLTLSPLSLSGFCWFSLSVLLALLLFPAFVLSFSLSVCRRVEWCLSLLPQRRRTKANDGE